MFKFRIGIRRRTAAIVVVLSSLVVALIRPFREVLSDDRPTVASNSVPEPEQGAKGTQAPRFDVRDRILTMVGSGPVALNDLSGEKATVAVFLSIECPISNGYIPTLNQLADRYGTKGIKLIGVNSNEGASLRELIAHRKEFSIAFPLLKDAGGVVAADLKAEHCPEAVVIDSLGKVRYQGRIDDRYSKRGGAAADAKRFDLATALDELLDGKPITIEKTKVVGCPIARRGTRAASKVSDVTYSEHIAPLLQKNCENCHRPGGIGPFALQSFEQATVWADDIREFSANRQMPPWLPVDGAGDFHNRRAMSADEIALITKWVTEGCAEGDRAKLPPPINFSNDWAFGEPDLIAQSPEAFEVRADGQDIYRCFVLPTHFETDRFVEAVEVRPGNSRVVHHVIVFLDVTNRSTELDEKDPGPGYATSIGFPGFLPAGGLGGWAPGNLPRQLPRGMAKVLPSKAKLVVQVHYHPSGKLESDQTLIGIHFSKQPVSRAIRVIPIMPFGGRLSGMRIPANADNAEVQCSITLPRDLLGLTVTPHMHLLGKDMSLTATLPDGSSLPLIKLQRWDFNWQESYQYREPVPLPKGTQLKLVAHFDNSAGNPANPNSPPKEVRWGENTADEMCIAFLECVPVEEARSPEDLKAPMPGDLLKEALTARFIDRAKPVRKK